MEEKEELNSIENNNEVVSGKTVDEREIDSCLDSVYQGFMSEQHKRFGDARVLGSLRRRRSVLSSVRNAFSDLSLLRLQLEKTNISLDRYLKEVGRELCPVCGRIKSVKQKLLKPYLSDSLVISTVVNKLQTDRESEKKDKRVMRSILTSLQYLCELTLHRDQFLVPSTYLNTLIETKSLGRYLNMGISYHYMSLIPEVERFVAKGVTMHVNPKNPKEKLPDYEFEQLFSTLPVLKAEANKACSRFGFDTQGNILKVTDDYYRLHKMELLRDSERVLN